MAHYNQNCVLFTFLALQMALKEGATWKTDFSWLIYTHHLVVEFWTESLTCLSKGLFIWSFSIAPCFLAFSKYFGFSKTSFKSLYNPFSFKSAYGCEIPNPILSDSLALMGWSSQTGMTTIGWEKKICKLWHCSLTLQKDQNWLKKTKWTRSTFFGKLLWILVKITISFVPR